MEAVQPYRPAWWCALRLSDTAVETGESSVETDIAACSASFSRALRWFAFTAIAMVMSTHAYPVLDVYTKPGLTENSYVAYVCSTVKFSEMEQEMPGMQTFYIGMDEKGDYFIKCSSLKSFPHHLIPAHHNKYGPDCWFPGVYKCWTRQFQGHMLLYQSDVTNL